MAKTRKVSNRKGRGGYAARDSVAMIGVPNRELTHRHVRTTVGTFPLVAADAGQGIYWTLSGLPNYAEFTAMYDRYIIDQVDIILVLTTGVDAQSAAQAIYPTVQFAYDPDDATAPASNTELLERGNVEILQFGATRNTFTRTVKPRLAQAAYRAGGATGFAIAPAGTFADISTPEVQFFGAKFWIANYNTTSTPNTRISWFFRHHMRLRGTR